MLQSLVIDAGYGLKFESGGKVIHELKELFKPTVEENVRIIMKRLVAYQNEFK